MQVAGRGVIGGLPIPVQWLRLEPAMEEGLAAARLAEVAEHGRVENGLSYDGVPLLRRDPGQGVPIEVLVERWMSEKEFDEGKWLEGDWP